MHKPLLAVLVLLLTSLPAFAQDYGSATYSIERWDEDYSYLKNPADRTDLYSNIKYIPVSQNPDWYVSLGGQVRDRYDYFNEKEFGAGPRDNGFDLLRTLVNADFHFGPDLRAFIQLDSSEVFGRAGGPRYGDTDAIDFQQAFVDVTFPIQNQSDAVLRVGRQELIYGAQRLVSPNDWRNVRQSFDGVKASIYLPNDTLDLFLVRPVIISENRLNSDNDRTYFGGIYNVTELPGVLPSANSKLDLYLLALDRSAAQASSSTSATTYTLGTRFHTTPGNWDLDVEPDFQFGSNNGTQINAYDFAIDGGYTWAGVRFTPRAGLGLDLASGSANPAHRFNQLFPPQYLYLGHMYLFGRENIIDLHPELSCNLTPAVTVGLQQHFFWRQNTGDAIYDLLGNTVRASGTSRKAFIGDEIDFSVNWQIQRNWSAYAGYAHFFAGPFLQSTGPHQDEDFAYAAVTYTF